jgi:hypothetical protein
MKPGHVVNQQTQPTVSYFELTLVAAGADGDAIRTTWDPITLAVAA